MKQIMTAALLGSLIATQSYALSCAEPDIAADFQRLDASERMYFLALGSITYASEFPNIEEEVQRRQSNPFGPPLEGEAIFSGMKLGANGFSEAQEIPVTVQMRCTAHWCGTLPEAGSEILAYIEEWDGENLLSFSACPGPHILQPAEKDLIQLRACLSKDSCVAR